MGYMSIMKDRFVTTIKSFGFSVRTMLQARKKLAKPKNAIYIALLALPLAFVIFVSDPIMAMTWLIGLFIYYVVMEAYAYSVVYGGSA